MNQKTFGILCFSPGFGGLEMNTLRLAQWMQERGWKVPLLLKEGSAIHEKAIEAGLDITLLQGNSSALSQSKCIGKWVAHRQLSTIMVPFRKDLKSVSFYKLFSNRKIRIVYQQHMQVGVSKRDPIHALRYSIINAWISPLEYLKEETIAKTYVAASKIHVIPLGLETEAFMSTTWTKEQARREFNLPIAANVIGVLGRIDPKKGQDLVIKGIHELAQKHNRNYHLLLLGDATLNEGDAYSMQLKKLVEDLHLQEKVHFRTYQPDVMQFFRAIDVFAMPSHGETYGMVTLEAMAAGVPVAGTDRDGTKDILKNGKLGYLFPKDDVAGFCNAILAIEQNKSLPQMLQQAQNEVRNYYSKDRMCALTEQLLLSL